MKSNDNRIKSVDKNQQTFSIIGKDNYGTVQGKTFKT